MEQITNLGDYNDSNAIWTNFSLLLLSLRIVSVNSNGWSFGSTSN